MINLDDLLLSPRDLDDFAKLDLVRKELEKRVKAKQTSIEEFFGSVIRTAIDEVLSLGAKRYSMDQLDSPEKTYVGTRVEILVRDQLDLGRGSRADALIAGEEVDIKWSKSLSWMIGPENLGTVCLGIGTEPNESSFSVGIFVPHKDLIRKGENRDRKLSLSSSFYNNRVVWLVMRGKLPPNFFASLPPDMRDDIWSQPSAQMRLRRLAELVQETPVPRSAIVLASLGKDDPLRRVRADASRKEPPLGSMVCLSEKYDKKVLSALGVTLPRGHFYFVDQERIKGIKTKE